MCTLSKMPKKRKPVGLLVRFLYGEVAQDAKKEWLFSLLFFAILC